MFIFRVWDGWEVMERVICLDIFREELIEKIKVKDSIGVGMCMDIKKRMIYLERVKI